ncbi:MAG: sigma 54-interacting transcriptional regulator [Desulfomonile tiedjei]|nr:sigma 54-interacting transcriptional regulator [Desulfomonile tiedjei]
MIDQHSIGKLLLETGRITSQDYSTAIRESRETGRSPHELLLMSGKVSVDELVQALTIHMDITLLKEALGMSLGSAPSKTRTRPPTSYLERISLLFKMSILLSTQTNMGSLVELLIREAPSVMNAERATIFLADNQTEELYSHLGVGLQHYQIRIPWNSGIAGWVFTHRQPLNIADPYHDARFNKDVDSRTGFQTKSLLCVPLQTPVGQTIGAFQVLNKKAGVFTGADLEIAEIFASQAARSIEHALEWDDLRERASILKRENVDLKQALQHKEPLEEIVGSSKAIQDVRALIRRVAPTETTVLIQGESGTGKELVARAIHQLSPRVNAAWITLNCAAVPSELIESELFGHKKGAFTGAVGDNKGVFRSADKGSLFLDEIEATSPAMQVKLLRAIQVGEIRPVGDNITQQVDVRLITATNRDLQDHVRRALFREDLFYRIHVFPITIPPLRERIEDVPALIKHFLHRFYLQTGKMIRGIDPAALDLLVRYPWPGNVRELENEIERAQILASEGGNISVRCLSPRITQSLEQIFKAKTSTELPKLRDAVDALERKMIIQALDRYDGNRSLSARSLGLSRQGLLNKMNKFGLKDW